MFLLGGECSSHHGNHALRCHIVLLILQQGNDVYIYIYTPFLSYSSISFLDVWVYVHIYIYTYIYIHMYTQRHRSIALVFSFLKKGGGSPFFWWVEGERGEGVGWGGRGRLFIE